MKNRWIQIAIVAVGGVLIWGSLKSLLDLRKAGGRVDQAKQDLVELKAQNQDLKKKLTEVSSNEFVEKEARDKLNLQKPGEVVVLMPKNDQEMAQEDQVAAEKPLSNPEKWWKLFFE